MRRVLGVAAVAGLAAALAVGCSTTPDETVQSSGIDGGTAVPATDPPATDAPAGTTPGTSSTSDTAGPTTSEEGPIDTDTPVNIRGIGPVEAGMTVAEAEDATGQQFILGGVDTFEGYCFFAEIEDLDGMYLLVEGDGPDADPSEGVIGRVTIDEEPWRTDTGLGPGSAADEVRSAYGDRIVESPHEYIRGGLYLDVQPTDPADEGYLLRFEVDQDGVVVITHAGLARPASLVEGCA